MIDSRASVDSEPQTTRSYSSLPSAAASASAVWIAHAPCSAGSLTCTALSAPMDSALRIVSAARSGPIVRTVTSPPCASLSRRASSIAYSSISFMTASTDSRSSVLSESDSRRSAHVSGTCLTSTTMFTPSVPPP